MASSTAAITAAAVKVNCVTVVAGIAAAAGAAAAA
jgi:hypothetical protein